MNRLDEIKLNKNGLHVGMYYKEGEKIASFYEINGFEYDIEKCFNSRYFDCGIRKAGTKDKFTKLCTRANVDTCISKIMAYIKENA